MRREKRLCSSGIGGQAVMEGIMMRNQDQYAVAVRKPDKSIVVDVEEYKGLTKKNKFFGIPFIRGIFSFIDSLVLGIKTLTYSANFFEEDEEDSYEESKFETWLENKLGSKAEKVVMGFTVVLSVIIAIALFMVLPLFIADMMERFVPGITRTQVPIIEGVVKIIIFIAYLLLISLMKDIKRTFMYHGAEHKCINCIETGKTLSVDNVRTSSRFHKRCGTSFILLVLVISIIFFIFINPANVALRYGIRILLIPVIAGISYEFIRLAGNSNNKVVLAISKPGLWMQKITTKEPTDSMIEVAIEAVEAVFDWEAYLEKNGNVSEDEETAPRRTRNQTNKRTKTERKVSRRRERETRTFDEEIVEKKPNRHRREAVSHDVEFSNINLREESPTRETGYKYSNENTQARRQTTRRDMENASTVFDKNTVGKQRFIPRENSNQEVKEIGNNTPNRPTKKPVNTDLPKGFKPTNGGSGFNWK